MGPELIVDRDARVRAALASVETIDRPRLIARLDELSTSPVSFVTGPAGSGKSVLVDAWTAADPHGTTVKVNLDGAGGEPEGTLVDLAASGLMAAVGMAENVDAILAMRDPAEMAAAFAEAWYHDISGPELVRVVFDAVPTWEVGSRLGDLAVFLDRIVTLLGDRLHMVVVTRRVAAPLETVSVHACDAAPIDGDELAFTLSELVELASGMRAHLEVPSGDDQLVALHERTRGWAVGVVSSLTAWRTDTDLDVASSTVRAEVLLDAYFAWRVLDDLQEPLRRFLEEVAFMDAADPAVCDDVFARSDSRELFETLEQRLAFVTCPDPLLGVYEIFPLFAESLRRSLERSDPQRAGEVGRLSSERMAVRVRRIVDAERFIEDERWSDAIDVIVSLTAPSLADVDIARARALIRGIPFEAVRDHPFGLQALVQFAIDLGDVDQATELLAMIEDPLALGRPLSWSDRTFSQGARAALGRWHDDTAVTVAHATRTLQLLAGIPPTEAAGPDGARLGWARSLVLIYGGGALERAGRLGEAASWFSHAQSAATGIPRLTARALAEQALVDARFGRFAEALTKAERSEAINQTVLTNLSVRPEVNHARAVVAIERDELDAAQEAIDAAQRSDRARLVPEIVARGVLLRARLALARGDFDRGLAICGHWRNSGAHVGVGGLQAAIVATEIRLSIRAGSVDHARRLARRAPDPSVLRGSLAWLDLIAVDTRTLSVRVDTWPVSPLPGARIEYHLFAAIRSDLMNRTMACTDHLVAAARLAEPEGFYRVFLDSVPGVTDLVVRVAGYESDPWLARLVWRLAPESAAIGERQRPSPKEANVLELLATEHEAATIADHLGVSVNTLKSHQQRIYRKLGAKSRGEAVRIATEFGLVAPLDEVQHGQSTIED